MNNKLTRQKQKTKVFGLGMPKTATTTLEQVLGNLGYRVCNGSWKNNHTNFLIALYKHNDIEQIIRMTTQFDAFADGPWGGSDLYRPLYDEYPDAKFILTNRDTDSWYRSLLGMFQKFGNDLENAFDNAWRHGRYGTALFFKELFNVESLVDSEDKIKDAYEQHNDAVERFFKGKPNFLKINLTTEEDSFEKIIEFLEMEHVVKLKTPDNRVLNYTDIKGKGILKLPHKNRAPDSPNG